jgi:phosphonoacetaldehyde hydrolase
MSFPVRCVIFDWAGTMIDFGCMAPVDALLAVFAAQGVPITATEARADMGRAKHDHLRAILENPGVAARWQAAKGTAVSGDDVEALYEKLVPAMARAAAASARLIPGAAQAAADLRTLGVRIGSGTGYTREMMAPILASAAGQGYAPDIVVCAGETPSGRPAPLMTWKALVELDAWPANACIKIDDAAVGITEGKLAGCWTIGLSASGNGVGLDLESFSALPPQERQAKMAVAEAELRAAGADFVIADISQLMPVVHQIAERIAAA